MKRLTKSGTLAVFLILAAGEAEAAGFSIFEQGAKAMGTAGAFAARADDPSAIFYNPAGVAQLSGTHVYLNPNIIFYGVEFAGIAPFPGYGVSEEVDNRAFFPTSVYATWRIDRKWGVGLGFNSPFGLEVKWANRSEYTGRFVSARSQVTPYFFTGTGAYNVTPDLSLGVNGTLVLSKVKLERNIAQPFGGATYDVGTVALETDTDVGGGFSVAGRYVWREKFLFGLTYHHSIKIDYTGSADFEQTLTGNAPLDAQVTAQFPPDQKVSTTIEYPNQLFAGVAYVPNDLWAFEFNFDWAGWSTLDRIDLEFDQTPANNLSIGTDWKNSIHVRMGAEYKVAPAVPLRAGYYYDETPQPQKSMGPLLPDSDRHGLTLGAGYGTGPWTLDGYFLWVLYRERSSAGVNSNNYNGDYDANIFITGLSVAYAF